VKRVILDQFKGVGVLSGKCLSHGKNELSCSQFSAGQVLLMCGLFQSRRRQKSYIKI